MRRPRWQSASASPTLTDVTTADFSAFRNAASEAFVPLSLKTDDPDHFIGRIRGLDLDDVHVSEIHATPHTVERTSELIARGDRAYVKVSLQLAGSGLLVQDGREAVMRPGDIALYDTNRPYSLLFEDDMRMMVIMFPRTQLELPPESVSQLTAVRFAHDATVTQLVAPFLERMMQGLEGINGAIGLRLARNAIDLVSTMLADELGTTVDTDHRSLLLARIRSYVEEQLRRPAPRSGEDRERALHLHSPPARALPRAGHDRLGVGSLAPSRALPTRAHRPCARGTTHRGDRRTVGFPRRRALLSPLQIDVRRLASGAAHPRAG